MKEPLTTSLHKLHYINSPDGMYVTDLLGGKKLTENSMPYNIPRGYTMHEHLDEFGLINMNSRLYSQYLSRFLAPDPYIQDPTNSQNFNRYSYCLNNPLKYTDPSGEFWLELGLSILSNAIFEGILTKEFGGNFWKGAAVGAMSSVINQVKPLIPFSGIFTRGMTMTGINIGINGLSNQIKGDSFFSDWKAAAIICFVNGAVEGGVMANQMNNNLWWGNDIAANRSKWSVFNYYKADEYLSFNIPNAGDRAGEDCVPTTMSEVERYYGGHRTYEDFSSMVNYKKNIGSSMSVNQFNEIILKNFPNAQLLNTDYDLFMPLTISNSIRNKELYIFLFQDGEKLHADVLRGLKVFHSAPLKKKLIFRQSMFNYKCFTTHPMSIIKVN